MFNFQTANTHSRPSACWHVRLPNSLSRSSKVLVQDNCLASGTIRPPKCSPALRDYLIGYHDMLMTLAKRKYVHTYKSITFGDVSIFHPVAEYWKMCKSPNQNLAFSKQIPSRRISPWKHNPFREDETMQVDHISRTWTR